MNEVDAVLDGVWCVSLGHLDGLALIDDRGVLINLAEQEKSMEGASHLFQDRANYTLLAQESEFVSIYYSMQNTDCME